MHFLDLESIFQFDGKVEANVRKPKTLSEVMSGK